MKWIRSLTPLAFVAALCLTVPGLSLAQDEAGEKKTDEKTEEKPEKKKRDTSDAALDEPIGDHVKEHLNVAYVEAEKDEKVDARHKLDIFVPKKREGLLPVVVFYHGGMWASRDKRDGKAMAYGLCDDHYVVISVGYRLVSVADKETRFPRFLEDAAKGLAWIHANVKKYGGDPDKIVVSGHSAGGHIAGVLATNSKYLKAEKLEIKDVIKGFIGISGPYSIPSAEEDPFAGPFMDSYFPSDAQTRKDASPVKHVDKSDPPALLMHGDPVGEMPTLVPSAKALKKAYDDAKVAATLNEIKGRNHDTIMREFGGEGDKAEVAVKEFLLGLFKAEKDGEDSADGEDGADEEKKGSRRDRRKAGAAK